MKNEIQVKVQFAYAFPITSIFLKKKNNILGCPFFL